MGNLRSFRRKLGDGAKKLPERLARKLALENKMKGFRQPRAERRREGGRQRSAG